MVGLEMIQQHSTTDNLVSRRFCEVPLFLEISQKHLYLLITYATKQLDEHPVIIR